MIKIYAYDDQESEMVQIMVVDHDMPIFATSVHFEDMTKTLGQLKSDFSENGETVTIYVN